MNRKSLWMALGCFAALLVGAALFADVAKLQAAAVQFPFRVLVPAAALVLGNYGLRAIRFRSYLAALGIAVTPLEALLVFVSGMLLTVTPGKMGEIFKGYLLHERRGTPVAEVASSVVAERFTDVVGLLAIAAIGVSQYGAHAALFLFVVGLCLLFLLAVAHPRLLPWLLATVAARAAARPRLLALVALAQRVHGVLRTLCAPRRLAAGVALAAAAWLLEAVAFRLILDGAGAGGGLGPAIVIYAMATLFGAVSMLPGGVGGTEAVMIALCLTPALGLGLAKPEATLVTLLIRFATLWFGVACGGVALLWLRRLPVQQA